MTEGAMSALLSNLALIVTQCFTWLSTAVTTVTDSPLLLLTVGMMAAGFAFGLMGRAISRG